MASDKNKIVENYMLEQLRFITPDQSEIWTAKHRISKKNFTLKRVIYPSSQTELPLQSYSGVGRDEWRLQNIVRETNILKRLILETAPRCHKMIKTSKNIYVVYDELPSSSLAEHLASHRPSKSQIIALMQSVARGVAGVHAKTVVLLNISAANIFLGEKNSVFFSDWSMARQIKMGQKDEKIDCSFLVGTQAGLAREVIEGEKWSYWSDVYSLGCLFQKILGSGFLQEPQSVAKQLQQLIGRTLLEKPQDRPKMDEIINKLHSLSSGKELQAVKAAHNPENEFTTSRVTIGFRIKHSTITPVDNEDLSLSPKKYPALLETPRVSKVDYPTLHASKSVKSTKIDPKNTANIQTTLFRRIQSQKSFDLDSPIILHSRRRKQKEEENRVTSMQVVKSVSKKRNLAFFLLDLSQFVLRMQMCPQLGYMLLKYALLTLESAGNKWQRQQHILEKEKDDVTAIINSERDAFSSALKNLKENFKQSFTSPSAKKELGIDSQISERFLSQKIIQFGKQMVVYCEQSLADKESQAKLVECLFKTYMIFKKIEDSTYQKFWDKIYNDEYAFLHSQRYLREKRQLGRRYLKSRIAQILRGK